MTTHGFESRWGHHRPGSGPRDGGRSAGTTAPTPVNSKCVIQPATWPI